GPFAFDTIVPWTTATAYHATPPASAVSFDDLAYICAVTHVAGTFETDLAAGKWIRIGQIAGQGPPGEQGATGPAAWTGVAAWATGTIYTPGPPASVVTQGGSTFVCIGWHLAGTFAADLAAGYWRLVAAKGDTGATGPTGPASWLPIASWSSAGVSYTPGPPASVVSYAGLAWVCIQPHVSGPTTNPGSYDTGWRQVGAKGDTGPTGPPPWQPPEPWITGTHYAAAAPSSCVTYEGETYVCLTAHTAGDFVADLAAGRWIKIASASSGGGGGFKNRLANGDFRFDRRAGGGVTQIAAGGDRTP
ncbi:hypothetical protein CH341_31320, partial [Rhodoplanes roseus]